MSRFTPQKNFARGSFCIRRTQKWRIALRQQEAAVCQAPCMWQLGYHGHGPGGEQITRGWHGSSMCLVPLLGVAVPLCVHTLPAFFRFFRMIFVLPLTFGILGLALARGFVLRRLPWRQRVWRPPSATGGAGGVWRRLQETISSAVKITWGKMDFCHIQVWLFPFLVKRCLPGSSRSEGEVSLQACRRVGCIFQTTS